MRVLFNELFYDCRLYFEFCWTEFGNYYIFSREILGGLLVLYRWRDTSDKMSTSFTITAYLLDPSGEINWIHLRFWHILEQSWTFGSKAKRIYIGAKIHIFAYDISNFLCNIFKHIIPIMYKYHAKKTLLIKKWTYILLYTSKKY